jgi:hypothetical protein
VPDAATPLCRMTVSVRAEEIAASSTESYTGLRPTKREESPLPVIPIPHVPRLTT